jgi:hypothetical protein
MYRLVIMICWYHRDENGEKKAIEREDFGRKKSGWFSEGLLGCDVMQKGKNEVELESGVYVHYKKKYKKKLKKKV